MKLLILIPFAGAALIIIGLFFGAVIGLMKKGFPPPR